MKNIPNKIYLQIGDISTKEKDVDFKNLSGVSWCENRINKTDIAYVLPAAPKKKKSK